MNIVELHIAEVKEYDNNPRLNDNAVDAVAESISRFGFKVPIIVDGDNVIVAGHTRLKAARQLGLEYVPCIVADDLTEEQVKAFRLADNKTSEFADWDFTALEKELAELVQFDIDMSMFDLDILENEIDDDVDDLPEAIELPREDIGTAAKRKNIKFGSIKIYMSDEEAERFEAFYKQYLELNGNVFGFVTEILDNGDSNYAC